MSNRNQLALDSELFIVWYLTDTKFKEKCDLRDQGIDWDRIDWNKAILEAKRSRTLLYKFSNAALETRHNIDKDSLQVLESVVKKGNYNLKRLKRTLETIKDLWQGKVEYFIVKTRDDRPTGDADVLFMRKADYETAINIAIDSGYRFMREEPFKGWVGVKEGVKIELHHNLTWFGMKALDKELIMRRPRQLTLMNLIFQTINEEAELGLELAHWIMDIQALGQVGFSNLVSIVEKDHSWQEIFSQARKYHWERQLVYHLGVLNEFCKYVYSSSLRLPVKLPRIWLRPRFPFETPVHIKIPFLTRKILKDNEGFSQRFNMLQLALRRYAWTRMWD